MNIVQLHFSVLTIKLLGYSLCVFFAAKALGRLNNLNIDIGGRLIRARIYSFLLPLIILLISPVFDVLYELYNVHAFQHVSMVAEGISGILFAFAFLKLCEALK